MLRSNPTEGQTRYVANPHRAKLIVYYSHSEQSLRTAPPDATLLCCMTLCINIPPPSEKMVYTPQNKVQKHYLSNHYQKKRKRKYTVTRTPFTWFEKNPNAIKYCSQLCLLQPISQRPHCMCLPQRCRKSVISRRSITHDASQVTFPKNLKDKKHLLGRFHLI